jgi:hypothetical protein
MPYLFRMLLNKEISYWHAFNFTSENVVKKVQKNQEGLCLDYISVQAITVLIFFMKM